MAVEEKLEELKKELVNMQVAQIRTCTKVDLFVDKVDKYIDLDEKRYVELNEFRVKSSELLATAAESLNSVKKKVDSFQTSCPNQEIVKTTANTKTQTKIHGWTLKTIVGFLILAALGGLLGGMNSCFTEEDNVITQEQPAKTMKLERRDVKRN